MMRAIRRSARRAWLRACRGTSAAATRNVVRGPEEMEPRLLLSIQPVVVGSVYVEEDLGSDLHGDTFYLSFQGGAPGTELTHVEISGDQNAAGFTVGDVFFDTSSIHAGSGFGRFGADESFAFTVVSQEGIEQVRAVVADGTTLLRLDFEGFEAGDRLVFSIDVDEVEDFDAAETDVGIINDGFDPVTSGVEFQGSSLLAGFSAANFEDLQVQTEFVNRYDALLDGTGLPLPADDDGGKRDRTAGAVGQDQQVVIPASLSGHVYHDFNQNGRRDPGEEGLSGVTIQAVPIETVVDQTIRSVVTDAAGYYEFEGLMPGSYRLLEVDQPAGYFDWLDSPGTVDGRPSGTALNPGDVIDQINLPGGGRGVDYDFGEILPVSIRGQVHLSTADGDCFGEDVQHEPLADVEVRLLDSTGQQVARTTTDRQGRYEFRDLMPGVFTLVEVTPDGLFEGGAQVGTVAGRQSPDARVVDPSTIDNLRLYSGQDAEDFDFCEHPPSSLSGFVYHDQDDNGQRSASEQGLAGAVVQLVDLAGQIVASAQTDDQGAYHFAGLEAGEYRVVERQPQGWLDGRDAAGTIDGVVVGHAVNPGDSIEQVALGWGQHGVDYDFGELLPIEIRGRVHLSTADGDCFSDDVYHEPLSDVVVELLSADGQVIGQTLTDEQGVYVFNGLAPGRYGVHELTPAHLLDGDSKGGQIDGRPVGRVVDANTVLELVVQSGQTLRDVDFCEHEPAELSGYVYHDRDDDGQRDPGEAAIAGVTLVLFDGGGSEVGRAQTDASGRYLFARLPRDQYRIVELQPDGWQDGRDTAGRVDGMPRGEALNPGDEIRRIALDWGQRGEEYNFGELLPSSLSGRVHADLNADCLMQPNEWPLAGVTIELLDASGQLVARQSTDAEGRFRFDNLRPGQYTLRELQPEGYFTAGQRAGSGGGDDRLPDLISQIDILSGQDLVDYRFCEEPPSVISGYVFQDGPIIQLQPGESLPKDLTEIRDGRLTPDDHRLAGVVVELRHGIFGTPIDGSSALPGYYPDGPIRTVTDDRGFYQFEGLRKGNYSLYEIQPPGFVDSIDTGGNVPAIAINRHDVDDLDPQVTALLQQDPNFDAIVRLALFPAVVSTNNNFSEIQIEVVAPPPSPPRLIPPGELPPPTPIRPAAELELPIFTAVYRRIQPLISQLSPLARPQGVSGNTWHLSVLNGGQPRGEGQSVADRGPSWLQSDTEYRFGWDDDAARQMYWVWVVPDESAQPQIFGIRRGIPVAGDFNGDGFSEIGVFVDGQWFIDLNGNGQWDEEDLWAKLGYRGDQPVVGDWDGDGKDDIGVFGVAWSGDPQAVRREPGLPDRQNDTKGAEKKKNLPPQPDETTDVRRDIRLGARGRTRSDVIDHVFLFGATGHQAIVGDWNGDGISNLGVFDNGVWYLDQNGDGEFTAKDREAVFGQEGDVPIVGDFNGDGIDEIGILSNGRLVLDVNRNFRVDEGDQVIAVERRPGRPVVGDWNGDGKDEVVMTYDEIQFVEVDARH